MTLPGFWPPWIHRSDSRTQTTSSNQVGKMSFHCQKKLDTVASRKLIARELRQWVEWTWGSSSHSVRLSTRVWSAVTRTRVMLVRTETPNWSGLEPDQCVGTLSWDPSSFAFNSTLMMWWFFFLQSWSVWQVLLHEKYSQLWYLAKLPESQVNWRYVSKTRVRTFQPHSGAVSVDQPIRFRFYSWCRTGNWT